MTNRPFVSQSDLAALDAQGLMALVANYGNEIGELQGSDDADDRETRVARLVAHRDEVIAMLIDSSAYRPRRKWDFK